MKKYYLVFLSLLITKFLVSQLSNELIWSTGTFYPNSIQGINSTIDGDFYTSIESRDGNQEIIKYKYKNNKEVDVLFSNKSCDI